MMRRISSSPQVAPGDISSTSCYDNINNTIIPKVHSDSNLEGLHSSSPTCDLDRVFASSSMAGGSIQHEQGKPKLYTEPSFGIYSADDKFDLDDTVVFLDRSASFGERRLESQFSFGMMQMIQEDTDCENEANNNNTIETPPDQTYQEDYNVVAQSDHCYNALIRQNPSNPVLLKNYAHFLQSKGDLNGAEEYYLRATVADPKDGETLSRCAKLVWELHHDYRKALSYFERAVQAAPGDSHIQAAYASFLWEADEDEEPENSVNDQAENADDRNPYVEEVERPASPPLHLAMGLGLGTIGYGSDTADIYESSNTEEYYRKMVDENPCNPLFLRNYAYFLHKSKGDLHLAEDYYSRAILLDPCNGQLLSLFANLVWDIHHDKDRAESYFVRAVQSSPKDSNVLGSYAKFLWDADDEKDDVTAEAQNHMHLHSPSHT